MAAEIIQQRMTGRVSGDFVVFLIGMRVNRWWKVHQWVRVAAAMPRMIHELLAAFEAVKGKLRLSSARRQPSAN